MKPIKKSKKFRGSKKNKTKRLRIKKRSQKGGGYYTKSDLIDNIRLCIGKSLYTAYNEDIPQRTFISKYKFYPIKLTKIANRTTPLIKPETQIVREFELPRYRDMIQSRNLLAGWNLKKNPKEGEIYGMLNNKVPIYEYYLQKTMDMLDNMRDINKIKDINILYFKQGEDSRQYLDMKMCDLLLPLIFNILNGNAISGPKFEIAKITDINKSITRKTTYKMSNGDELNLCRLDEEGDIKSPSQAFIALGSDIELQGKPSEFKRMGDEFLKNLDDYLKKTPEIKPRSLIPPNTTMRVIWDDLNIADHKPPVTDIDAEVKFVSAYDTYDGNYYSIIPKYPESIKNYEIIEKSKYRK